MKNLLKGAALTAVAAFTFTACTKDQRVVNRLEGDWKVTSVKYYANGVQDTSFSMDPNETMVVTYEQCSMKKDEFCSGKTVTTDNSTSPATVETENFKYKVVGGGDLFIIDNDANTDTNSDQEVGNITESSKNTLILALTDSYEDMNGNTVMVKVETTLEKQ